MQGTIASKLDDKGFGFIRPNQGGPDLFFHRSNVVGDFDSLQVGQEVTYTIDDSAEKPRAKSVTPGPAAKSGTRTFQNKPPQGPTRHKPTPRRVKLEFGFVTKLHRKRKQGFISANSGGKELQFDAMNVTGEKPYYALQIGDYVQFTRHSGTAESGPLAKDIQVTERKIRVDTGLDLPNHPRARRKKPSWR